MLGKAIKKGRMTKGYTMAELAEKVGVSTGYISHIEKDKVKPSLAVLGKLVDALDITMESVLPDRDTNLVTVVRKGGRSLLNLTDMPTPAQVLTPMSRRGSFFKYDVMEMCIPPYTNWGNMEIPMPLYYENDDCLYVLSGEVVCTHEYGEETIHSGGSAFIPRRTAYHIGNRSDEEASILLITKLEV